MNSSIGRVLLQQTPQRTLAVVVALATVAFDFGIVIYRLDDMCRGALGIVSLALIVAIAGGAPVSRSLCMPGGIWLC